MTTALQVLVVDHRMVDLTPLRDLRPTTVGPAMQDRKSVHIDFVSGVEEALARMLVAPPDAVILTSGTGGKPIGEQVQRIESGCSPAPAVLLWSAAPLEEAEQEVTAAGADDWLGPADLLPVETGMRRLYRILRQALRNRGRRSMAERDAAEMQDIALASGSWFWASDAEHRFLGLAEAGVKGILSPPELVRGRTRWELAGADPATDPYWRQHLEDLRGWRPFRGFIYQLATNKGVRWLRTSGIPRFDAAGRPSGYRGMTTDITAEMEARASADLTRARLTDAIESMPAAIALYDSKNRLVFCNDAARQLGTDAAMVSGTDYATILARSVEADRITPEDEEQVRGMCQNLRRVPGRVASLERHLPDGRWLLLSTHATARGEVVSIQFDITARKLAEESLRQREARLHSILQNLAEAVLVVDSQGLVSSLNRAAERMFGWPAAEIEGRSVALLMPESGMLSDEQARRRLLRARLVGFLRQKGTEPAGRRRNGATFPLELSVTSTGRHGDRIFIVIARDLAISRALEAERQRLALAVEHSPAGILMTRANGIIEYANPRFCEVTGWTLPEIVGRTPRILNSGLTPREVHADLWRTILDGRVWHGRLRNRRKDGQLYWTENHIAPIRDSGGRISHFVAIEEDVTEAIEREAELMRAMEEAELANRTKSEFLANISHELRTPLNAIIGFSQLLAQEAFGPLGSRRYHAYSEDILRSGQHLLALIDEILDISRIELGKASLAESEFDPVEQIEACMRMILPRMQDAGLDLDLDLEPGLPGLRGDQLRFWQVILNLLSNSAKFTPDGGSVTIQVSRARLEEPGDPGGLEIRVRDTGIGMSAHEIGRALMPFAQVESPMTRRHGGTGLGLTIAVALLEQHQGSLSIESAPGQGTTVLVRYPAGRLVKWDRSANRKKEGLLAVVSDARQRNGRG